MSQPNTRRPGSSGGTSRSDQRPLRATQRFGQHGSTASASQSSATGTSSNSAAAAADRGAANSSKKKPSPSSSPFVRVPSSPDPSGRSRSPGSPAATAASKAGSAKIRRSPGASPVPLVRQSPQHLGEKDVEDAALSQWRLSRPNSIDMQEECGSAGASGHTGFIIAGSPSTFARLPRASSRGSVGSISSELETLVLNTSSGETAEPAPPSVDGRRPPVLHLVSRHGSTPNMFGSPSTVSPVSIKTSQGAPPSPSALSTGSEALRFSPSPRLQLSRRGSSEFESPSMLPIVTPVMGGSVARFMSGSPKIFDCIPPPQTHATVAKPMEPSGFQPHDLSQGSGPDRSKVNITFSQSTVFQQCIPAGQS